MCYMMHNNSLKNIKAKNLKEFIIKFLKERNYIISSDNTINSPKAFLAASILRFCHKKMIEGNLNEKQLEVYFKALYEYEKSVVELKWENGVLKAQKNK